MIFSALNFFVDAIVRNAPIMSQRDFLYSGRLYRPYLLHLLWSRRSITPRFKSVLSLQPII